MSEKKSFSFAENKAKIIKILLAFMVVLFAAVTGDYAELSKIIGDFFSSENVEVINNVNDNLNIS